MEENKETKKCKYCQSDIPKKAKICPNCRKKQGGGILKWIIIVIVILVILMAATSGSSDNSTSNSSSNSTTEQSEPIEYTAVEVSKMMDDLNSNAMSASDTYKGQYLEVTGILSVIDSSGKYISLIGEEYSIIGITCYIKTDEQKEVVKQLTKGDTVTLKGKCTDVGEVFGYYLDIDSISE